MKKYITTDGKTCRPIDEPNSPLLNLTKEMPIGEFEGKDVWQLQDKNGVWITDDNWDRRFIDFKGFQDHWRKYKTRIAISPIEKPLEGEEESQAGHTHALKGYVRVEEVVALLENHKRANGKFNNRLDKIIAQIKNFTK